MPHFVIEYSRQIADTVDLETIMDCVFYAAVGSEVMLPEDIKVRAVGFDYYRVAGKKSSFIHVTASLLDGRTDRQKERIACLVRSALAELLPKVISISIDVRDMNSVAYKKRLL
jgi:5-carboxymethyl-2-hydroxymuconate isomerase